MVSHAKNSGAHYKFWGSWWVGWVWRGLHALLALDLSKVRLVVSPVGSGAVPTTITAIGGQRTLELDF